MLKAARRPETMLQEIQSAEEWIEGFFADWDARMDRYKGPAWRPGGVQHGRAAGDDDETFDRENFAQEWVAHYSSHLVLGNPRARFTTSRSGDERTIVKAHELATNRWVRETNMRRLNEKLAVDFGHHRAVCLTLPSLDPVDSDKDDMRGWPSAKRISVRRSYIYDTAAIDTEEELWRGHKSIHQRHEMIERARANPDEGWDEEEILALAEEYRVEEVRGGERGKGSAPRRDEIVIYSIWMRDYEPTASDRKFHGDEAWDRQLRHGAWLTLGMMKGGKKGRWVRRPFPYWGHARGPYVIIDGYYIPDEACGLAPIPAIETEVRELNMHTRAESVAMKNFKNGVLVDGSDPEFMEKIQMFEDQFVVGLDGLDDIDRKVKEIQLGGSTDQHAKHREMLRDRVNRRGGITDVQRGQTDAGVTATADQLAENASQNRVGFIASKFIAGIREILDNISVYLAFSKSRTRLGPEAKRTLKDPQGNPAEDVVYNGGIDSKEEADWFFSLGIEIEPYSMGQTSEALEQQRILQMMNLISVLLPLMASPAGACVLWDDFLETLGEMMNVPNFADYFDIQALQQIQSLLMQTQLQPAQAGAGKPQPRLAQDMSRLQSGRPATQLNGNLVGALQAAMSRSKVATNGAA